MRVFSSNGEVESNNEKCTSKLFSSLQHSTEDKKTINSTQKRPELVNCDAAKYKRRDDQQKKNHNASRIYKPKGSLNQVENRDLYRYRDAQLHKKDSSAKKNEQDSIDVNSFIHVKSIQAAQTIDLDSAVKMISREGSISNCLGEKTHFKPSFDRSCVIMRFEPSASLLPQSSTSQAVETKINNQTFHLQYTPRFVAIFRFGSVVFFNFNPKQIRILLEKIKKCGNDSIPPGFERRENLQVCIRPGIEQSVNISEDFTSVHELNRNSVAVISTVMAHTVALDSYNETVDELLASFAKINNTVKKTGNFTAMERETIFKIVAQNNAIFIELIAKLGIKDRSDTAWNLAIYERIYDEMKDEFEIDLRFDRLEYKLNLIQQNAKFFLEIKHHEKSNSLEWIIIVLIAFECVLMVLEMSGIGPIFFEEAFTYIPSSVFSVEDGLHSAKSLDSTVNAPSITKTSSLPSDSG